MLNKTCFQQENAAEHILIASLAIIKRLATCTVPYATLNAFNASIDPTQFIAECKLA